MPVEVLLVQRIHLDTEYYGLYQTDLYSIEVLQCQNIFFEKYLLDYGNRGYNFPPLFLLCFIFHFNKGLV